MITYSLFREKRSALKDKTGTNFPSFVRSLKPKYWKVYLDIVFFYLLIAAILYWTILITAEFKSPLTNLTILLGSSLAVGLCLSAIQLYFHEAAHGGLHQNQTVNDLLANIFIGVIRGQEISNYRRVHMDHHRHHGKRIDPENSYFNRLCLGYLVRLVFGVHAFHKIVERLNFSSKERTLGSSPKAKNFTVLILGFLLNLTLCAFLWKLGGVWPVLTWVVGILSWMPLFLGVRQLLEHRGLEIQEDASVDPGAFNFIFKLDPICFFLGAAGFRYHLYHHLEPTIHCSNLRQVDEFFSETDFRDLVEKSKTTYLNRFKEIYKI